MFVAILNEETKRVAVCEEKINDDFFEAEVEQDWKGDWYLKGYAPTQPLDELKAAKLVEVNNWTEAKITGGFVSKASGDSVTYDSDIDTQITMSRIRANCENPRFAELYPNGCPVRGYPQGSDEKQVYMLTAEQIIEWDEDLGIHIGNCKQNGWAKQAEVVAAESKEDLEAIVLN